MFNKPLGSSPTLVDSGSGRTLTGGVPITGNFINNAVYMSGEYRHHLNIQKSFPKANDFSIGGRIVTAWAPKKNVNLNFDSLINNETSTVTLPNITETASSLQERWYGLEIDLLLQGRFYDHLVTSLEMGMLMPRRAYDIDVEATPLGSVVSPIVVDRSEITYGSRLTVSLEF